MSMTTELIEEIRECAKIHKESYHENDQVALVLDKAADTIQLLSEKLHASQMERSSQYYHGGLIPVSERLPEERGYYLVQILAENGYHQYFDVTFYRDDKKWEKENVTAWMPLPEKYTGGE